MGFGQSSAFGGPVNMPALERLANEGLRYNQFHTAALCSPTRTALLTGRNHHMNNMGGIAEVATALPSNTGVRPNAFAPLAETLRQNGTERRRSVSITRLPLGRSAPSDRSIAGPPGRALINSTASSPAKPLNGRRLSMMERSRSSRRAVTDPASPWANGTDVFRLLCSWLISTRIVDDPLPAPGRDWIEMTTKDRFGSEPALPG